MGESSCEILQNMQNFRVGFRQNGFFVDFYFWAAGFSRGFSRRIFPPHFCGKKYPEKSSRKIPKNPPKFIQQKSPTHFCRGAGPKNSTKNSCHNLLNLHRRVLQQQKRLPACERTWTIICGQCKVHMTQGQLDHRAFQLHDDTASQLCNLR